MLHHHWPVPGNVRIAMTDRNGGVSLPPFDSLNLGTHVGDDVNAVMQNRALLRQQLQLPAEPAWLEQVHGTDVIHLGQDENRTADGSYADRQGQVAVVMTADCLPVLLCDSAGTQVAALHAGWRGLNAGVLEAGIAHFRPGSELFAYLGPAIGPSAFEVGAEVRGAFLDSTPGAAKCFTVSGDKYLANLEALAGLRLKAAGVMQIYAASACTYTRDKEFFSYRRDRDTGRMASLIWLEN
ncbi:peptidoglycan editing factor PgeF [Shewanella sp. A32]|uniref:peptidoglycan editing factor PgeF n=1 Tax=Shewanella sp. A32 TaxID=3031327 RepID=UPI0023B8A3A6|nr:peptidoglycan editing factor PgeF [Shewanella sp. A32]MDF0536000.1 peptidoglycan editing factor PgeF [Shewanella sp. A32]